MTISIPDYFRYTKKSFQYVAITSTSHGVGQSPRRDNAPLPCYLSLIWSCWNTWFLLFNIILIQNMWWTLFGNVTPKKFKLPNCVAMWQLLKSRIFTRGDRLIFSVDIFRLLHMDDWLTLFCEHLGWSGPIFARMQLISLIRVDFI